MPSIRRVGAAAEGSASRSTVVMSSLARPRGVGAGNRNRGCFFGSAEDDGGLRGPNTIERADAVGEKLIEGGRVTDPHLQHEAVFARDVVDFLNLRHGD